MLILTRRLGESINIGDNIKISVLGVSGRQVRLGIEAPSDVVVHREEVYVRIQEENQKASKSLKRDLGNVVSMIRDKIKGRKKTDAPEIEFKNDRPRKERRHRPRGDNR